MNTKKPEKLKRDFEKYNIETSQDMIQEYLDYEYRTHGMKRVLDLLFEWSLKTGYITEDKLKGNKRYSYYDPETKVTFRAQVNYSRSGYIAKPDIEIEPSRPHCAICYDNIGAPGKENLRAFRFFLRPSREFFIQLTPFPLFEKHYILIDMRKIPMKMDQNSVEDLSRFVMMMPSAVGCSNSDIEWAGSSILEHHHYQIFERVTFPVMEARPIADFTCKTEIDNSFIKYELLDFPIACCRVQTPDKSLFVEACGRIIMNWKRKDEGRNTCNLVVQHDGAEYICYIFFRNPAFRTPVHLRQIKSEGVGIVEVAGEGIYPIPKGDSSEQIWHLLENEGLSVVKGIIEGNNPVRCDEYDDVFRFIRNTMNF